MPPSLRHLRNRYFVMRHAQSHPNVAGLIVCRPPAGLDPANGLTTTGRQQARDSATAWIAQRGAGSLRAATGPAADTTAPVIISSDFSRARETAEILREVATAEPVGVDVRLRERDFGDFDGCPASAYQQIWAADAEGRTLAGVEPVGAVLARVASMIDDLEQAHAGRDIVLVSHGDTAQIAQAGFCDLAPSAHRSLPPLGNAEIRPLNACC